MTRDASSWSGSTAGPTASAARVARALRSPVTAGTMRSGTASVTAVQGVACVRFDDLTGTVLAGHHPPGYGSSRHPFAGRALQGGGGWTRRLGWAWARPSAPTTLA